MSRAAFTYQPEPGGPEFQWHGGAYIDVGYTAQERTGPFNDRGDASYEPGEFMAYECINVWDYAKDEPTIGRDLASFQQHCDEWLAGDEDDDAYDDESESFASDLAE